MAVVSFVTNAEFANNNGTSGAWFPLNLNSSSIDDFFSAVANGGLNTSNYVTGINTTRRDTIAGHVNWLHNYNFDCSSIVIPHWTHGIWSCIVIQNFSSSDILSWDSNYAGRTLKFKFYALFVRDGVYLRVPYFSFSKTLPYLNGASSIVLQSDVCVDYFNYNVEFQSSDFNSYNNLFQVSGLVDGPLFEYSISGDGFDDCFDLRTSTGTNECKIRFNYLDIDEVQQSDEYTLLFQPDSQHTSGSISDLNLYRFTSIVGCSAHFVSGSVRGAGIITVRGKITGTKLGYNLGVDSVPGVRVVEEDVILLQASFSPCCDWPDSYSETYSSVMESIGDGADAVICTCHVTSIEWSGFENLTDYCCDDSDCSERTLEYPPNSTVKTDEGESGGGGEGGEGGGSTDITCICENLENLISMLGSKLDMIAVALSGLELTSIVEPCSPNITVSPAVPAITVSPANPSITVSPAVPAITVSPANPTITVEPCSPTINVSPCQPTIQNVINEGDVSLDNSDLIDKLDELFNTSGENKENITDVLKNKELGNNVEVEVTPNELVSLRKVFYENFEDN